MKIKLSRHAKRRAKLYGISESIVVDMLSGMNLIQGDHTIKKYIPEFKYPLKIVVSVEDDLITVVTNYPLKKERKK